MHPNARSLFEGVNEPDNAIVAHGVDLAEAALADARLRGEKRGAF